MNLSPARPRHRAGFTRSEVLIVLGVVVIAITITGTGVWSVVRRGSRERAEMDIGLLREAITGFFNEYFSWPSEFVGSNGDARYGKLLPNAHVLNALRAVSAPGNPDHKVNPNRVNFLRPGLFDSESSLDDNGDWRDPWGTPYQLVFDTDLDGDCFVEDSSYGRQVEQDFLVWSCGPDGISDTYDDILGWDRVFIPEMEAPFLPNGGMEPAGYGGE